MQCLPVKLAKTWTEAYKHYNFPDEAEGLCVEYNLLTIAELAGKHIEFTVKRRKQRYVIDPSLAKEVAKAYQSFFTRKTDRKVVVVIPRFECQVIT